MPNALPATILTATNHWKTSVKPQTGYKCYIIDWRLQYGVTIALSRLNIYADLEVLPCGHWQMKFVCWKTGAWHMSAEETSPMLSCMHPASCSQQEQHKLSTVMFSIASWCQSVINQRHTVYFHDICSPIVSVPFRSRLRSADNDDMIVPRTRTARYGPRSFRVAAPQIWNVATSSQEQ